MLCAARVARLVCQFAQWIAGFVRICVSVVIRRVSSVPAAGTLSNRALWNFSSDFFIFCSFCVWSCDLLLLLENNFSSTRQILPLLPRSFPLLSFLLFHPGTVVWLFRRDVAVFALIYTENANWSIQLRMRN
eukprot:RCo025496